ncbi:hypothetical protein L3Q82_000703 [Scortum barcoo]|uniref:Uncharacterized protein n=1 Tax=Scortum barcoo TaxID=214431 RepID=A0ACB8WGE6_9TELE|nr:hypothetical protein L3Q82_000703 [Scortum barcoo]
MRFSSPGRGTLDQLYTLHRVLEGLWEFAQPVHMCFVDLEKAFDRVPRGILWGVLHEYGAVQSLYDRSRSLVRIAGSKSDLFPVHVGLRQGCPLSPVLFIIFMDRISRRSQGGRRESGLGTTGFHLCFLQMMLSCWLHQTRTFSMYWERFAAECEAAGMRISTSKSKAMVLDWKRVACPLQVGGEVLPQVEEFKYLGVLFRLRLTGGLVQRPCSYAVGVPDRRGEEGAESKGEALDLPVNLHSHLSPMVMNFG